MINLAKKNIGFSNFSNVKAVVVKFTLVALVVLGAGSQVWGKSVFKSAKPIIKLQLPLVNNVKLRTEIRARRGGFLSPFIYKKMARAQAMIERGDMVNGLKKLAKLAIKTKSRPFERAQVLQALALAQAQGERYQQAISNFKKALDLAVLPLGLTQYMTYNLVQLLLNEGSFSAAEVALNKWFSLVETPTSEAYILMAQILAEKKYLKASLLNVEAALSLSDKPKEMWLRFAVSLYLENKNFVAAQKWLHVLVRQIPTKKEYWLQLSGVYLSLGQEKQSLATLELAQKWGHLKESREWINLASLCLMGGVPIKAVYFLEAASEKKLIKRSLKYYELLAHSWIQAEEWQRALPALEKAAQLSGESRKFLQLGQLQMELENWVAAIGNFKMALKAAKDSQRGKALMGMGMAHYYNHNTSLALIAFKKIKSEDVSFKAAKQWIQFI